MIQAVPVETPMQLKANWGYFLYFLKVITCMLFILAFMINCRWTFVDFTGVQFCNLQLTFCFIHP